MADYFCDHGAYASTLGATPTWGVPQEGDGSSKDAATTSSIGSIAFASVPSSGTLSVFGASVSTTGVTGAASADAAADALAANINATTASVTSGFAVGTPQLRNLVFARGPAGGAPAGTCQIMCRVGSTTLNVTGIASTLSAAPTLTQFAGGSGGCWGLLINAAAIGVSASHAAGSYGRCVMAVPYVCASSAAPSVSAVPGSNDNTFARTGSGYYITLPQNVGVNFGGPTFQSNIVFDTNSVWTADTGTGVVTIAVSTNNGDVTVRLAPSSAGATSSIRCIKRGALRVLWASNPGNGNVLLSMNSVSGARAAFLIHGVTFEEGASIVPARGFMRASHSTAFCAGRLKFCDFLLSAPRTSWTGLVGFAGMDGTLIFEGCSVFANITTPADPYPVFDVSITVAGQLKVVGCNFYGWTFGRFLALQPGRSFSGGAEIVFDGCTGLRLGGYLNISAPTVFNPYLATYTFLSADVERGFRHEYLAGVVDWNPEASPPYPKRSALQLDGATKWSVKIDWFASTVTRFSNLCTPPMSQRCRLPSAPRTAAVYFLSPVVLSASDIAIRVHYIGTDGLAKAATSWASSAALTTPSNDWTGASSYPGHLPYRLSLTTPDAVGQGTDVAVYLEVCGSPPGGTGVQIFVDPEVELS